MTTGANFINFFFVLKRIGQLFSTYVCFLIFLFSWRQNIGAKCAHKKIMKLTAPKTFCVAPRGGFSTQATCV